MSNTKRLCPMCGAANPMTRVRCEVCNADMQSNLPVPLGARLPVPWKQVGASLAVSAGALALRAGLRLARDVLERKAARAIESRERADASRALTKWLPRGKEATEAASPQPQVRVWGKRVWRRWNSDGSNDLAVEEVYWQANGR